MLRFLYIYRRIAFLLIFFLAFNSCRKQKKTVSTDLVRHEEKAPVQAPKPVVTEYIVKVEASNSYAEQFGVDVDYFDANSQKQHKTFRDKIDFNAAKALLGDQLADIRSQLLKQLGGGNLLSGLGSSSLFGAFSGVKRDEENKDEAPKEEKKLLYQDTFLVTKQIQVKADIESQKLQAVPETQIEDNKVFLRVSILDKNGVELKKQELTGKSAYSTKEKPNIITIVVP